MNANAAEKFGIIIPFGDFDDDLKAAFYAHIHINVRWEFAPLAAAYANDAYLEKTNLGSELRFELDANCMVVAYWRQASHVAGLHPYLWAVAV